MTSPPGSDLLQYYAAHFRTGLADLSTSSAPATPLTINLPRRLTGDDCAYVPPSGAQDLAASIAARYRTVEPSEVLITAGASEALVAAVHATLNHGDSVAFIGGAYPSAVAAASALGASTHPDPRLILACNPTTPGGQVIDASCLAAVARRGDATLVIDEVYREIAPFGPPPGAAVDIDERAVSIGDLSKPLGMGGLRIGWLATHDRGLGERLDRELQLLSGGPSSLSVAAATSAMETFDERLAFVNSHARKNFPAVAGVLAAHGWSFEAPQAGPTLTAAPCRRLAEEDFARARKARYFLLPGEALGRPGTVRISLFADAHELDAALTVLAHRDPKSQPEVPPSPATARQ